jgi:oligopeptide/dipeptide ABC transporter, ATP-binding protein, C-terminal domain
MGDILVEGIGLRKHFRVDGAGGKKQGKNLRAVDGVDIAIRSGETMALVGESGCGKSTLGRLLIRLAEPTEGKVLFDGEDIAAFKGNEARARKRDMQIVFQDPYASLDPRMKILDTVGEPLATHEGLRGAEKAERVARLLEMVGLDRSTMQRYPHMFSGGQRQRIGIARALALDPRFVVCDEPVSALDVSIQAQVLNLLMDLRERKGLTYLFISHDLGVVRRIADRVCVMFLGKIVESGPVAEVYARPRHPYTMFLVAAAPLPDPKARYAEKKVLVGEMPSPTNPPSGCRFRTRCPYAKERCANEEPSLAGSDGRAAACHYPLG